MGYYKNDSFIPSDNDSENSANTFTSEESHTFSVSLNALEPHYHMTERLGRGGFGAVYQAIDRDQRQCAVKVQDISHHRPKLSHELKIYQKLYIDNRTGFPTIGIPRVYDYAEIESQEFLVMERMGKSLEAIVEGTGKLLSKKDALMIGIQVVRRLETIHRHGILHRDIKPGNLVMGLGPNQRTVHLIDFGLATIVEDWDDYDIEGEDVFAGTEYFASVEALFQKNATRSGDLQSLAYTLLALVVGNLPWKYRDEETGRPLTLGERGIQRLISKPADLCVNFPELTGFMKVVRRTKRIQEPGYDHLVSILEEALTSLNCENDGEFEWLRQSDLEGAENMRRPSCPEHDSRLGKDTFFGNFIQLNFSLLARPLGLERRNSRSTAIKEETPKLESQMPMFDVSWSFRNAAMWLRGWNRLVSMTNTPKPKKLYYELFPIGSYNYIIEYRQPERVICRPEDWQPDFGLCLSDVTANTGAKNDAPYETSESEVLNDPSRSDDNYYPRPERDRLELPGGEAHDIGVICSELERCKLSIQASLTTNGPSLDKPSCQTTKPVPKLPGSGKKRAFVKMMLVKGVYRVVKTIVGGAISSLVTCGGLLSDL